MYEINHNWSNWKTKVQSSVHSIGGLIKEKNWNSGQKWLSLQTNDQNKKYNKV